jgi:long-chain acyl-CoA synthetase
MTHPALAHLEIRSSRLIPGVPPSVAELLDPLVASRPDEVAVIDRYRTLSFRELDEEVDRAAAVLHDLGIGPIDRVSASLPNQAEIVVMFLASMRLGAMWAGVNRNLALPERSYLLGEVESSVYVADDDTLDLPDQPRNLRVLHVDEWRNLVQQASPLPRRDVDPQAPAGLGFTSGTTGRPKAAVHSQHNMVVAGYMGADHEPGDRHGAVLPLTILNLMVVGPIAAFARQASFVAIDHIDAPGIAERVKRDRVKGFAIPPAIAMDLLSNPEVRPEDLESLTARGVGATAIPPGLEERYRERFGRTFGQGYGLTEAPAIVTYEEDGYRRPGGSGIAKRHLDVTIRDKDDRELSSGQPGEVCVGPARTGPHAGVYTTMLGYWNQPDASREALRGGHLHTGDIGHLDSDGVLYITDRKNDLIIRGGANIYPAEVERVLHQHPAIRDCAVVGHPDERLGETVVAFVEYERGMTASGDDLRTFCQESLARYKTPVVFHDVGPDGFPRNAMGKIQKRELRGSLS